MKWMPKLSWLWCDHDYVKFDYRHEVCMHCGRVVDVKEEGE